MEFEIKQYDGPYEVAGLEISNEGEMLNGLIYFPPKSFRKPYPVIIYFHGFPQLYSLSEIIKSYKYLLDLGFAFIVFNFRGYRFSEGNVSINSQVSDSLKILEFIDLMGKDNIFNINKINIIGHDFGAYIALILCSKIRKIHKLILIAPILDLQKHIYQDDFKKLLYYINRFLTDSIKGISNIAEFINLTKKELSQKEHQIRNFVQHLKINKLKIVVGTVDKITPISEVEEVMQNSNIEYELILIEVMDHDIINEEALLKINKEIKKFFEY
ncbi:MAG: alpha/beta fold hydrolase [Promethearchaeota archaeon]|nr:MAG: alpha/beta fold hydrolase [Candidatus Lokiarchaeota archaeon]